MQKRKAEPKSAPLSVCRKSIFYCKKQIKAFFCIAFSSGRRGTAIAVDEE